MIGIVVLGTVAMDSGILLLLLERWRGTRRPAWSQLSAASMGRIGPMLDRIAQVESERAHLDHAIDTALPERSGTGHDEDAPTSREVVDAYAVAEARLVALSAAHLHGAPSATLSRFVELSRGIGHDLDDDWDPHADELAALSVALRDLHVPPSDVEPPGCTPWESAADGYRTQRRRRATDARIALLGHLNAVRNALRTERRQLALSSEQSTADLDEVNRELRRAIVARLDSLRPLLVEGHRRLALPKRDRTTLAGQLASAARQLAAADALARTSPLASLRALAAVQLPSTPGLARDAAFATGCRAVEAGLRVCAARGDAELSRQIEDYAKAIDVHLDKLLTAVIGKTHERRRLHHTAFRSALAAADRVTLAAARAHV
ncbi:MAG: hypothetical protein H0X35_11075 [Pseudonocardiales bacterium]|nr:hypothetical protein [Pseudonocardiales bacterium]